MGSKIDDHICNARAPVRDLCLFVWKGLVALARRCVKHAFSTAAVGRIDPDPTFDLKHLKTQNGVNDVATLSIH